MKVARMPFGKILFLCETRCTFKKELNIMAEFTSMPSVMETFLAAFLFFWLLESREMYQLLFEQFQKTKSKEIGYLMSWLNTWRTYWAADSRYVVLFRTITPLTWLRWKFYWLSSQAMQNNSLFFHARIYKTYTFFDSVHFVENIRKKLLSAKKLVFPGFDFEIGGNKICTEADYICWHDIHKNHNKYQKLSANLRKAPKLSYQTLHPSD